MARDLEGNYLDGGAGNVSRVTSAIQAETIAAMQRLERAANLGMARIILETDVANFGLAITSIEMDRSPEGDLFRKIRLFMSENFVSCEVSVCPQVCNKVADCLATYGVNMVPDGERVFWCEAPRFVT